MFRKYVRNIALNLLTNMCSRYIINSARNTCSQTTVLKKYSGYNRVSIRRKRSLYVKKLFAGFFSIIMILGLSAFYGSGLVSAHDNAKDNSIRYKYYKSIQIHCGDTLWNIAEENMSDDYESVNDYITEVKKINKLSSDQIQDSQYLMVPYYSYNK